jgi:subtilisin family serine protease
MITELNAQGIQIIDRLDIISAVSCYLNEEQMELVKSMPSVRYIEMDFQLFMLKLESPGTLLTKGYQSVLTNEIIDWGVKRINAPETWNKATGKDVKVGVMDTGIATQHPDLRGVVMGGFNAMDSGSYEDDNDHGTYVASVIAARRNGVGIVGVAPDASLYAIKVMDSDGRGYISDVIQGCQWALDQELPVVNMSLGSTYESFALQEAVSMATASGMIIIAASGNEGKREVFHPAGDDVSVCVGASGMDDRRRLWSNYGEAMVDKGILAPGDWILAGTKDGGWRRVAGTSIATPHVTGIIALLLEADQYNSEDIAESVFLGASQSGNPDEFNGHGIVNARRSLDWLFKL